MISVADAAVTVVSRARRFDPPATMNRFVTAMSPKMRMTIAMSASISVNPDWLERDICTRLLDADEAAGRDGDDAPQSLRCIFDAQRGGARRGADIDVVRVGGCAARGLLDDHGRAFGRQSAGRAQPVEADAPRVGGARS